MQLVTPTVGLYQYENSVAATKMIHRECTDEIEEMFTEHPDRFLGMGIVPMQDPPTAIAELEDLMGRGFKGIILNDHVAGVTYDEPCFLDFFAAAQDLGARLFFHQGGETITRRGIPNTSWGSAPCAT